MRFLPRQLIYIVRLIRTTAFRPARVSLGVRANPEVGAASPETPMNLGRLRAALYFDVRCRGINGEIAPIAAHALTHSLLLVELFDQPRKIYGRRFQARFVLQRLLH